MRKAPVSILLAALLIGSVCVSCGGAEPQTSADSAEAPVGSTSAAVETEAAQPKLPSTIPDTLDLAGETVNIWYFTKNSDAAEHFVDLAGSQQGDIVDNALYERNLFVEEALNVDLNFIDTGVSSSLVESAIRNLLMAGDNTYDLYSVIQFSCAPLALEHCFLNLSDAPYIDLSQPWWSRDYINAISVGTNHVYFLTGDISLDMIRCIGCMYYNKAMYANYYDNADAPYESVLNGTWTLDVLRENVKTAYTDLNGSGTVDEGDQFGLVSNLYNNIDAFSFGAGAVLTKRDKDNIPYVTISDPHNAELYVKLYDLMYNTPGTLKPTYDTLGNVLSFANGKSLFVPGFLYTSENLRDMKDDYGILPFPKYDEAQTDYCSCVHDIATLMCLPTTCQKVDTVCAVLEAMAYYSYNYVTPVYYETALKTKYTRDDVSSQIIDIIHDTSMTDLAYVYSANFNDDGFIMCMLIQEEDNNYASYAASQEKADNKAAEKFIQQFLENDD